MGDGQVKRGPGRPPLNPSQRKDTRASLVRRKDGWNNVAAGLGGQGDKRKQTTMKSDAIISPEELEAIYMSDGIGARIINLLPDDMTREGWELEADGFDEEDGANPANIVQAELDRLSASSVLREGLSWKRLYGGALIFVGALDGQELDKPLNPNRISTIDNLRIIDMSDVDLMGTTFQTDPTKPNFGKPLVYKIYLTVGSGSRTEYYLHATRCIESKGVKIPQGATRTADPKQRYWGMSVLQNIYQTLSDLGGAFGSVGNLMYEVSIGKFTLKDLLDILSQPDGSKMLATRIEAMDLTKSVLHSIFLAEGETFERDSVALAGVPEILYQFMMLLAGSSGYPITRLFGTSPGGMNATGESDMRNYYDMVRAAQRSELKPILSQLIEIIKKWKKITAPIEIKFNPLQQMTQKEEAEVEKLEADAENAEATMYNSYVTMQALTGEEVRQLRWAEKLAMIKADTALALPPVGTPTV